MRRKVLEQLIEWKSDPERKPLLLRGARQVGKTWLMNEFGRTQYKKSVYFNFEDQVNLGSIFEADKNPRRIIDALGAIAHRKITPGDTLIILDEVQECPSALSSLKQFHENANEYHVIAAESLLGALLAKPQSYPVGQVDLIKVYPLNFDEFLAAVDESLYDYYAQISKGQIIEEIFHKRLLEAYRYYLIVGGMPACVSEWVAHKDTERIDRLQESIVTIVENDFGKHNRRLNEGRIFMVFRSIVSQLAKENEKFIYGAVREGARARDFEEAIEWLVSAGILNRVYNVSKPEHPLKAFEQLGYFKLFVFDTGLLKHMADVDNSAILLTNDYQFKGPLTENYVLQQLIGQFSTQPHFFSNREMEIDFLIQNGMKIVPLEVKGGQVKTAPSFKSYIKNRQPQMAIRYSTRGYVTDGAITNIPLYLAAKTRKLL